MNANRFFYQGDIKMSPCLFRMTHFTIIKRLEMTGMALE